RYTIDYRRKVFRSRPTNLKDRYFLIFYLDIIGIIGWPLRLIIRWSGFFNNITFILRY
ncbi:hypothetical protein BKA59DRAFT_408309, partial [Fusarium tricinctum]